MTLRRKMILLFSIIMTAATVLFAYYAYENLLDGADLYTTARFINMSATISQDVVKDIDMMHLTINSLTDNTSFMTALNQFVRDDSDSQQMASAARTAAVWQLSQSPLVHRYKCVAFFSRSGLYLSSSTEKDSLYLISEELPEVAAGLTGTSEKLFTIRQSDPVFGLIRAVYYHDNLLGYLAVLDSCSALDHVLEQVDNPEEVTIQVFYKDGMLFYSDRPQYSSFPLDLPEDEKLTWTDPESGITYELMHRNVGSNGLQLFIAQNIVYSQAGNRGILKETAARALGITACTVLLITLLSFGLTNSIRRLTKKVSVFPSGSLLLKDPTALEMLNQTVTSPADKEIHVLEQTYNRMMLRLSESAVNELALREGTLHAQLNALQTQINPHFIYNTLNIISAKSMESGNLDVIEICDQFASMLRYSTDTRSQTATLQEELDNVRNYLLLAKARYEDNLDFVIDVPDVLHDIEVPKLTLQPLVENALTHGFNGKNIQRRLSVIGQLNGRDLILTIRDNGTGFSDEMLENLRQRIRDIDAGKASIQESGGHIGLINTCLRLHYYSKGAMRIRIDNDNGALVIISLPLRQEDSGSV